MLGNVFIYEKYCLSWQAVNLELDTDKLTHILWSFLSNFKGISIFFLSKILLRSTCFCWVTWAECLNTLSSLTISCWHIRSDISIICIHVLKLNVLKIKNCSRLFNTLTVTNTPMAAKCHTLINLNHRLNKFSNPRTHKPTQQLSFFLSAAKSKQTFVSSQAVVKHCQMLLGYFCHLSHSHCDCSFLLY